MSRENNREPIAFLRHIVGSKTANYCPLYEKQNLIGRKRDAQVYAIDCNISRNHCTLNCTPDGWTITDLGSRNGTYLNNQKLESNTPVPLPYDSTIFLGPPSDAPEAYVFLKDDAGQVCRSTFVQECSSKASGSKDLKLPSVESGITKPPPDLPSTSAGIATTSHAACADLPKVPFSRISNSVGNGFLSDSSVSSMDSLKTRIKKMSSKKKKKRPNRLLDSSDEDDASFPSTSSDKSFICSQRKKRSKKDNESSEVNGDQLSSIPSVIKKEDEGSDSVSLLRDSMILADCDSYPFSEPMDCLHPNNKKSDSNRNSKSIEKLNTELQTALAEKAKLQELVQVMKLREGSFDLMKEDFKKMLEEELLCNICTEVYMKAVALGCSHTFCEYCITEWKKKKKQCPICREKIVTETKVLVLDSFILKMMEHMDQEYRDRRQTVVKRREDELKMPPPKKRKKARRSVYSRRTPQRNRTANANARNNSARELDDVRVINFNNIHEYIDLFNMDFDDEDNEDSDDVEIIEEDDDVYLPLWL